MPHFCHGERIQSYGAWRRFWTGCYNKLRMVVDPRAFILMDYRCDTDKMDSLLLP
jgi:hypothetical protein